MIVTEYNGHPGFLVEAVDTILRLDWSLMRVPPEMISNRMGGLVTAVTELNDQTLVMMIDVEKVLAETTQIDDSYQFVNIEPVSVPRMVFYADDSAVGASRSSARSTPWASATLAPSTAARLGKSCNAGHPGRNGPSSAQRNAASGADRCGNAGDGRLYPHQDDQDRYPLCRHPGADAFLAVGHSNQKLGQSVGVDEYVSKFEPHKLAQKVRQLLAGCAAVHAAAVRTGHPAARLTPVHLAENRFRR